MRTLLPFRVANNCKLRLPSGHWSGSAFLSLYPHLQSAQPISIRQFELSIFTVQIVSCATYCIRCLLCAMHAASIMTYTSFHKSVSIWAMIQPFRDTLQSSPWKPAPEKERCEISYPGGALGLRASRNRGSVLQKNELCPVAHPAALHKLIRWINSAVSEIQSLRNSLSTTSVDPDARLLYIEPSARTPNGR